MPGLLQGKYQALAIAFPGLISEYRLVG